MGLSNLKGSIRDLQGVRFRDEGEGATTRKSRKSGFRVLGVLGFRV